jgi:hypothetical protein
MVRSLVARLALFALAALPVACASVGGPAPVPPVDLEAALIVLEREMEASLANGPGQSLTELEGLIAAYATGAEGGDAASLWRAEIRRQYRFRRRTMRVDLDEEVQGYDRARIGVILGRRSSLLPDALPGPPDARWRMAVSFHNTRAYRLASMDALCASMRSTPRAWAARYPRRAPFTFQRFGIDAPRIAGICAARDRRPRRRGT